MHVADDWTHQKLRMAFHISLIMNVFFAAVVFACGKQQTEVAERSSEWEMVQLQTSENLKNAAQAKLEETKVSSDADLRKMELMQNTEVRKAELAAQAHRDELIAKVVALVIIAATIITIVLLCMRNRKPSSSAVNQVVAGNQHGALSAAANPITNDRTRSQSIVADADSTTSLPVPVSSSCTTTLTETSQFVKSNMKTDTVLSLRHRKNKKWMETTDEFNELQSNETQLKHVQ